MASPHPSFELHTIFGRTNGHLLTKETAHSAVDDLADVAADIISAAYGAGVSLINSEGQRLSVGATSDGVLAADDLQYELGEGPCLSAWSTGVPVYITDTHTEKRWQSWTTAAAHAGIRSCLSVPLLKKPAALGAMKVYSDSPDAFSGDDRKRLLKLAHSAAALLGHVQASDTPQRISTEVRTSLAQRDAIGLARGILMERHDIGVQEAKRELLDMAGRDGNTIGDQASIITARENHSRDVQDR